MLISEFYSKFTSKQEKSRLFDALRQVSQLESRALWAGKPEEPPGWAEWPPSGDESGSLLLQKA